MKNFLSHISDFSVKERSGILRTICENKSVLIFLRNVLMDRSYEELCAAEQLHKTLISPFQVFWFNKTIYFELLE